MKENSVETKIVESASAKIGGKYNLAQYKNEKARLMAHKQVCQSVLDYKKENPSAPTYVILSAGINAGAFKTSEFAKGYKSFDANKVNAVVAMAHAYNKKMGIKGKPSDVVYRLAIKYYNKKSHDVADFEKSLNVASVADGARGHFAELCKNLGM